MAEVTGRGEKGEEETDAGNVVCTVCLQPFRQPRFLPCTHTFCLPCLQQLAAPREASTGELEEREPSKSVGTVTIEEFSPFNCPTCRKPVTVPPGGVVDFKVNFSMEAEVVRQTTTPIACDTCDGHAQVACSDCQKRLCSKCRQIHDHFINASYHSFIPLNQGITIDADTGKSSSPEENPSQRKTCPTHGEDMVLFCEQCDAVLCHQCQKTSHRGHVTDDLSAVMERSRKEMQGLVRKVQDEVKIVDEMIKSTNQELQELTRQEEEVIRQSVEAAGKVTAWANQAENNVVHQIHAISAPIRTKLLQQRDSTLERKSTLNQLKDRARCIITQSGSFLQLKALRKQMEASLSADSSPTVISHSKAAGGTKNSTLFHRHSSGQELLQTTVPTFVGEVTACGDNEQKNTSQSCQTAWEFQTCAYEQTMATYTTAKGFTVIDSFFQAMEYTSENQTAHKLTNLFAKNYGIQRMLTAHPFRATTLPSSVTLLVFHIKYQPKVSLLHVGSHQHSLVPATLCSPAPVPLRYVLLSHDSMPNGRHAYTCNKKLGCVNVYEIQELVFSPPATINTRPVFQIVYKNNIMSFDVSSDSNYFAVLSFIRYYKYKSYELTSYSDGAEVAVFKRRIAEPCAVFRSSKTSQRQISPGTLTGDVCFSPYNGKEMLRVSVSHDDTVYILDYRNGCTVVGTTFVDCPQRVRLDGAGRVWIMGPKQLLGFTTSQ